MNSSSSFNSKSTPSTSPALYMHEWLAVITIISFLLLLITITYKSRFQEKEDIAGGVLAVRAASTCVANNVQIVKKKRQPSSKSSQKPKAKLPVKRTKKMK